MTTTTLHRSRTLVLTTVFSLVLATGAALLAATQFPAPAFLRSGVHSFDSGTEAVDRLDPALRAAVQKAARDAHAAGVDLELNSGWRSREHQQSLFDTAVKRYGSRSEALRWVATPDTSPHVSGNAVDVGPPDAAQWLADNGTRYGLCRTFTNEPWHFELATTVGGVCPAMHADASALQHDPR